MKTMKFKPSEVGPIPEEWEVKRLGDVASNFNYGVGAEAIPFVSGRKYIRITDIDEQSRKFIPPSLTAPSFETDKSRVNEGDILVARTGASVGKTYIYDIKDGDLTFAGFLMRFHPDEVCPAYVFMSTLAGRYKRWVDSESARSGQPGINIQQLKTFEIPIPPRPEQEKIAEALSDVDALLAAMTKLIEKKRAIKQGAMQQLLTGKKRLAGFTGKWVEKRLGECSTMFAGGTPSSNVDGYYGGAIPWVSISDISIAGKYIEATSETLTEEGLNNSSAKWYPQNTLLFAMYASIGKCCIARKRLTSSQAILGIYNFRDVDIEFLYYLLTFRNGEFLTMGQTGTQANLSKSIVEDVIIDAPTLAEQKAIAAVLSDMDAEIALLESKRAKYESIKQGMMQELLTGKTRLV